MCPSWMCGPPGRTCGSADLTANLGPQKHAYAAQTARAAWPRVRKHVIAMPSPRPIHEEKGSGLPLDWDVIDADADLRPSSQTLPPELLHLESQASQADVGFISPLFWSLLPLPYREDLRLDGIADDTPVYTRSVRSP